MMVFGPVLGYVEQFKMVKKTNSVGSFSIDICAILLISNILRIFYWFEVGFGTPLLLQAFLMIAAQVTHIRHIRLCCSRHVSRQINRNTKITMTVCDHLFKTCSVWPNSGDGNTSNFMVTWLLFSQIPGRHDDHRSRLDPDLYWPVQESNVWRDARLPVTIHRGNVRFASVAQELPGWKYSWSESQPDFKLAYWRLTEDGVFCCGWAASSIYNVWEHSNNRGYPNPLTDVFLWSTPPSPTLRPSQGHVIDHCFCNIIL